MDNANDTDTRFAGLEIDFDDMPARTPAAPAPAAPAPAAPAYVAPVPTPAPVASFDMRPPSARTAPVEAARIGYPRVAISGPAISGTFARINASTWGVQVASGTGTPGEQISVSTRGGRRENVVLGTMVRATQYGDVWTFTRPARRPAQQELPAAQPAPAPVTPAATARGAAQAIEAAAFGAAPVVTPAPAVQTPAPAATRGPVSADLVAVTETDSTGSIVYWSMGGRVSLAALTDALGGRAAAPKICSADVALRRAVKSLQERGVFCRPHPMGGWAVVRETAAGGELQFDVAGRAWVDGDVLNIDGLTDAEAANVRNEYDTHRGALSAEDLSDWMINVIRAAGAVGLRPTGGIYFIPRGDGLETVRACRDALAAVQSGCVVHEIPALRTSQTLAAIFDAMANEVQSEVTTIQNELAAGLGTRGARNRIDRVDALARKVRGYSTLTGRGFDAALATLATVRTALETACDRTANLEID